MRGARGLGVAVALTGVVGTGCGGTPAAVPTDAAATRTTAPHVAASPVTKQPAVAHRAETAAPIRSAMPPAQPRASADPAARGTLLYQRNRTLYRLSLGKPGARPVRLFDVRGTAQADPTGRYVAVTGDGEVVVRTVPAGRVVATVRKGDAVAFGEGTAVVAVRPVPPRFPHDCHRPTHLVEVDLRNGARRTLAELPDQFVPAAVVTGAIVGSTVPDEECETSVATVLDTGTWRQRTFGGGELRDVSPAGDRLWLHDGPDAAHAHGSGRIVDRAGRTLARLPYYGAGAFGPGGLIAYTETTFGREGTPEESFSTGTKIRTGRDLPGRSDPVRSLPEAGSLLWGPDGASFVARSAVYDSPEISWRAVVCTVRLVCADAGLTWFDEIELLVVTRT